MQKFEKFYFDWFEFDTDSLKAKFFYKFDDIEKFTEEIDFSSDFLSVRPDFDETILNNFLFSLSIALWISYYKLYPTKELVIKSWFLSDDDIVFWQKFYINWLWEFLYKNNLSPNWLFNFINAKEKTYKKIDFNESENILLPIWWWKDSIVSAELLLKNNFDFTPIVFWKIDIIKENCLNIMWKDAILIKRKLDENLFRLNELGYYNWHVPITWIISFALLTTAYLYDYKYIILSNEKSANSGNTKIWDLEINHQYSKSLEFEQDLSNYVNRNLSSKLTYFSLLRWMYEINIAEIFSKFWKEYFWVFSSCNSNFKILDNWLSVHNSFWCNSCPKCAFVYAILRPFISDLEVLQIFGKELYEDKTLENLFLELLWIQWHKPFECVGEAEEVIYAMNKSLNNFKKEWKIIPYILSIFEKEVKSKYDEQFFINLEQKLFKVYNDESLIPEKFSL